MGLVNAPYFGEAGEFRRAVEMHGPMLWEVHASYQLVGHRS